MSYNEMLSEKISLINAFKLSFEVFSKTFSKLFFLLAVLVVPVNLIYRLALKFLSENADLNPNLQASANVGLAIVMNPFFILVNLAVLDLFYSAIKKDEASVISSVINALKKWVKSVVTTILALVIVLAPVVVAAILASVVIPVFKSGSASGMVTIPLTILLVIVGALSVPYMLYFGINFMFFPLTVLVTGKWFIKPLNYSKRVVKGNWWFCLLLMIIFTVIPSGCAILLRTASANIIIEILAVIIVSVISAFLTLPYIIYYINYQELKNIDPA